MADLCPERAPLEGSLSLRVIHDSNPLSGAGSSTVTIRGDRFQLSDDAVAKAVTSVASRIIPMCRVRLPPVRFLVMLPALPECAPTVGRRSEGTKPPSSAAPTDLHLRETRRRSPVRESQARPRWRTVPGKRARSAAAPPGRPRSVAGRPARAPRAPGVRPAPHAHERQGRRIDGCFDLRRDHRDLRV